jgi:hypothetical protein
VGTPSSRQSASRAAEQEGNMETIIGIALAVIAAALIVGIIRVVSANQPA